MGTREDIIESALQAYNMMHDEQKAQAETEEHNRRLHYVDQIMVYVYDVLGIQEAHIEVDWESDNQQWPFTVAGLGPFRLVKNPQHTPNTIGSHPFIMKARIGPPTSIKAMNIESNADLGEWIIENKVVVNEEGR